MNRLRIATTCVFLITSTLLVACGGESTDEAAATVAPVETEVTNGPVELPRSTSPDGARVFFISLADGDTVTNPVTIEFGLEGMDLVPAGTAAPNSGHHHLIIDAGLPDLGLPIPANDNYIHFGDASASTERTFEPGTHTLMLLLGDYLHIPHDPPVQSETITITVE